MEKLGECINTYHQLDNLDTSYIIPLDASTYIGHHENILANIDNEHVQC